MIETKFKYINKLSDTHNARASQDLSIPVVY